MGEGDCPMGEGMTPKGCRGDVTTMRRHRGRALETTIAPPRGVARSREGKGRVIGVREKEREGASEGARRPIIVRWRGRHRGRRRFASLLFRL